MPLLDSDIGDLPYLDSNLNAAEREDAVTQVAAELANFAPDHATTLHPSVIDRFTYNPDFPPMTSFSHNAIAANNGQKVSSDSVDTSRYEAPVPPSDLSDKDAWKNVLQHAYISSSYLQGRAENLQALDHNGKNAWLISNSQIEDALKAVEQELKDTKAEGLRVEEERRVRQEGVRGEMEGLDETWKGSLGRAIEAEIAVEKLKESAQDKKRRLAHTPTAGG